MNIKQKGVINTMARTGDPNANKNHKFLIYTLRAYKWARDSVQYVAESVKQYPTKIKKYHEAKPKYKQTVIKAKPQDIVSVDPTTNTITIQKNKRARSIQMLYKKIVALIKAAITKCKRSRADIRDIKILHKNIRLGIKLYARHYEQNINPETNSAMLRYDLESLRSEIDLCTMLTAKYNQTHKFKQCYYLMRNRKLYKSKTKNPN